MSRELVGITEAVGAGRAAEVGGSGTGDAPARNQVEESAAAGLAEQLKRDLMEAGSSEVAAIRQYCVKYVELAGTEEGKAHLDKVYQSVRFLSTRAGLAGCGKIAQLTGAIEAMVFDQVSRLNGGMSPSSIQTLVQAVNCLGRLFTSGNTGSADSTCKASVLLVDDDEICNMANEVALRRANYDTDSVTCGSSALMLLKDEPFDLILLDINMPGMNGIEVCQQLRGIPHHKNTPVIFVTLHGDFQNRAQSLLSGGDDLISKPISPIELIVKATVFLFSRTTQPQVSQERARRKSATSPSRPAAASMSAVQSATTNGNGRSPHPNQSGGVSQPQRAGTDQSKLEGRTKNVNAFQATVNEKLNYLREALVEETKRREAVEKQTAENAKRRAELEAAIEEDQRSQQRFGQMLEESQKQDQASEQDQNAGKINLAGRRRALFEVRDFVADKLIRLKKALAEETKRREAVEQQAAENATRRAELETALIEIQSVQDAFQAELEIAQNPKQLLELESGLAQSQEARQKLAGELEEARRELQALRDGKPAQESELEAKTRESQLSKLEARKQELQAAHTELEQQVKKLEEALAAETKRREAIRLRAAEHALCRGELEAALAENEFTEKALQREMIASDNARRRGELEAELAENKQAQAKLQQDLGEAQKQLRAQREQSPAKAKLEARAQELEAAQAAVEQEARRLTESLAEEKRRREGAENQAAEIGRRRGELEAEIGQLQKQLDEAQKQRQAQQESSQAEQDRIEARAKKLQAAQAEVEQQVQRLATALTEETNRREGAEQQASEIVQKRSKLEVELGQLRQQMQEAQKELQAQEQNSRTRTFQVPGADGGTPGEPENARGADQIFNGGVGGGDQTPGSGRAAGRAACQTPE